MSKKHDEDDLFAWSEKFGTPERPENPLEAAYWEYIGRVPVAMELFDKFTRYAISRGRKRFAVSIIIERIRWETQIERGDVDFKINNNHRAYFARHWMRMNPEYAGFFETRRIRGGVSDALATGDDEP